MAGNIREDCGTNDTSAATEGMSTVQRCQSGDSIAEWRSSEQVENGTPSTSPPYWGTDEDDDCGPKPSELYGRFTWKIENFSTINKRELRSNAFEVGGYKWYILIYPQGCDVCNHLSLFLCVANHDKLLPGWSHFAQFTIAVVNKDPKKSKYSDTLHRFWKKEHDWGWKKFMELSKVYDGFIVADTLVIKAQVQVIREKAHRPFRCLDCQYRRELVRVYLSNVEQICRRFIEERRDKLKKLVEDKLRWPSFRAYWLGVDTNFRHRLSRDKTDTVLKIVVKHFFIEKEVTSTLVMDSLYSGLKALECMSNNKKGRTILVELEELPSPMIQIDKDMFVLADDVLLLLERATTESLLHQPLPPKDDKSSLNRTKEGNSGEDYNKDSIERDERRLMELGRRTVEIFVLTHIFSKIEVSYQEAVSLRRQEELIREEEAAWQIKHELKAKRGASEKEKRARKKQAKQKRNSRKGKDKGSIERFDVLHEKLEPESPLEDRILDGSHSNPLDLDEKIDTLEYASDLSYNGDDAVGMLQCDLDDRESSPTNWDTDTSEVLVATEAAHNDVQNGQIANRSQTVMDDSSSTCSTDSVPSVMNGSSRAGSLSNDKNQSSPNRGENQQKEIQQSEVTYKQRNSSDIANSSAADFANDDAPSHNINGGKSSVPEREAIELSPKNKIQLQKHLIEKDNDITSLVKKVSIKDQTDSEGFFKPRAILEISSSPSQGKKPPFFPEQPKQTTDIGSTVMKTTAELAFSEKSSFNIASQSNKSHTLSSKLPPVSNPTSEAQKQTITESSATSHEVNARSRPSSAPLAPAPRTTARVVSAIPSAPSPSRFIGAAGRLGNDSSAAGPSFVPESYRNIMMSKSNIGDSASVLNQLDSLGQGMNYPHSASTFMRSGSMLSPHVSVRTNQMPSERGFTFGSVKPESVQVGNQLRRNDAGHEATSSSGRYSSDFASNTEKLHMHSDLGRRQYSTENPSIASPYQAQGLMSEEFPHLDIINELLDEEHSNGKTGRDLNNFNRQYSFPGHASAVDMEALRGSYGYDQSEQYYDGGFQRAYGSSINPLQRLRDRHLSHDLSAYANGQIEGLMQNRWPYGYFDPSNLNRWNGDVNGNSYGLPDYSSSTTGINTYMYRPSTGR